MNGEGSNEWNVAEHVDAYLERAPDMPHRHEGEQVLEGLVSRDARRILDLGTGDGHLLALLLERRPGCAGVGVDVSEPMLAAASERFAGRRDVTLVKHDMSSALPELGSFDAVVSCFAIHHLRDERKRAIYLEAFELLRAGGVFCNLEHVSSPTERLHRAFYDALGVTGEDPSNRLCDVETQLAWLNESGFADVDCYWKWREMALLAGVT